MPQRTFRLNRRHLILTTTVALPGLRVVPSHAQTPAATSEIDQIALFRDLERQVRDHGREVVGPFLEGDDDAFAAVITPELAAAFAGMTASESLVVLESNRVFLDLPEFGAWFDGHFDGSTTMNGYFFQGIAIGFTVLAGEPQGGDVPAGRWTGEIGPGTLGLEIAITFSGPADTLRATLDIPSQDLQDVPFSTVTFSASRPVGDFANEQALPTGAGFGIYRAGHGWSDFDLVISAYLDNTGTAIGFTALPSAQLPPDPLAGYVSDVTYRLPVDGQLFVGWGRDTVFQNYHAASPPQRHAFDLLVWRDGATHVGDGALNEDYHIWGRPVVAPADGTVVVVENGLPDIAPVGTTAEPASAPANATHPEGNHVVIQIADQEFLHLAHMQEGSIQVEVGQQVTAGDAIGLVGNSGNTTEPHIHIHVQTEADAFAPGAQGVPLLFTGYLTNGELVERGVPLQNQFLEQTPVS